MTVTLIKRAANRKPKEPHRNTVERSVANEVPHSFLADKIIF